MREIDFTPAICKGKDAKFKGGIKIKVPSTPQRYRYISECGFKVNDAGEFELDLGQMEPMAKMIELSGAHYSKVNLEKIDGTVYSKFDELTFDSDCDQILIEVAGKILGGFSPSKN